MAITSIVDLSSGFGTVVYNGITFGPLRKISPSAQIVYDEADRSVTHVKYTFKIHGIIASSTVSAQNSTMSSIQDALTVPGKRLQISGIGFDSGIDTEGGTPDVFWGVKPRMMHFEPYGPVGWEVVWEVEFCMSRCSSSTTGIFAFNYDILYAIDEEGLTTRTLSGYIEAPAVRSPGGGRDVPFNVDRLWDQIQVRIPNGFRRGPRTRRIDEAKRRMEFSITDIELTGEAFPQGIVGGDLEYVFENAESKNFTSWMATLSGSLTVAPGYPNILAAQKFFLILFDKVARASQAARNTRDGTVYPVRLRMGHKLFGRTSSFSASFAVVACLHEILQNSGLWKALPGSNYQQWKASMDAMSIFGNRGSADLRWNNGEDRLIDICAQYPVNIGNDSGGQRYISGESQLELLCPQVTPERSYLAYQNRLVAHHEQNAVIHRYAQEYKPGQNYFTDHVTQYQGGPDTFIVMVGRAARLKFKPEPPTLLRVGGLEVEELARAPEDDDTPSRAIFDCPLYIRRWAILYRVKGKPLSSATTYTKPRPAPENCGVQQ